MNSNLPGLADGGRVRRLVLTTNFHNIFPFQTTNQLFLGCWILGIVTFPQVLIMQNIVS